MRKNWGSSVIVVAVETKNGGGSSPPPLSLLTFLTIGFLPLHTAVFLKRAAA